MIMNKFLSMAGPLARLSAGLMLGTATFAQAADLPDTAPAYERFEDRGLIYAGTIEVYLGGAFVTGESGNADSQFDEQSNFFIFGGSGRASVPWSNSFSTQFDVDADGRWVDEDADSGMFVASAQVGAHASLRDPEAYLIGLFGGIGSVGIHDDDNGKFWFAGIEGQYYWNDFTIYGQGGYMDQTGHDDNFHAAWFVRGVGRYFWTDNTMIQGELAYANGEQDTNDRDMDLFAWGLRLDHQFMAAPVTGFAAYEGGYYDNCCGDGGDFTEHAFKVGAKFVFGANSLKHNDRAGATLDLPSFGRWVAAGHELD
jgi:hypothetical protein